MRVHINQPSFLPGETIRLKFHFDEPHPHLNDVTNVSVDIYRVDSERNQVVFGFGTAPAYQGNILEVAQQIPSNLRRGLHLIGDATFCYARKNSGAKEERVRFEPVLFAVQTVLEKPLSIEGVENLKREKTRARQEYMHRPIRTTKSVQCADKTKQFRVLIFGVGCLLHARQQLAGYSISPLGSGLSHRRMHEIVNAVLTDEGSEALEFDEETERAFEASTPTFLVSYVKVEATEYLDALDHCRQHADMLFQILGLDRGQRPREFACFASEYGTNQRWHLYQMPGYRGNLVSDFNPASTANTIDRLLPKLQANPFLQLLLKTYANATAEEEHGFSLLRYWAVVELVADKYIPVGTELKNPDGSLILNAKGKPETTNSKHGRVYAYVLSSGAYVAHGTYIDAGVAKDYVLGADSSHPAHATAALRLSLWEMIRATYAIRNSVAHEGQFDVNMAAKMGDTFQALAAQLMQNPALDPLRFIKSQALQALWQVTAKV